MGNRRPSRRIYLTFTFFLLTCVVSTIKKEVIEITEDIMVKVFTKEILRKANNLAIKHDRNRTLNKKTFMRRSSETLFPVVFAMVHNDVEMRVQIILNEKGLSGWLDIPFKTYDSLPSVEV